MAAWAARMARDVAERGRTPACVMEQYRRTVRPMFSNTSLPPVRMRSLW